MTTIANLFVVCINTATKYVATIDENKKDVKHVIETLDDIYNYEDDFFKTIDMYEHKD